jgi:enediyne biosynthesis protein E5
MSAAPPSRFGDPRYYQIAVLSGLLTYGTWVLEFDVRPWQIPLTLAVALFTQWACTRLWKLPKFDPRSALISALSLCLLLRVDTLWVAVAAAFVAIASKFVVQIGKKHVFNPTNVAIVLVLLVTPAGWLSPGQWGNVAFFAFLMACLGGLVAYRALRSDVALAFIVVYAALLIGRSLYVGEPMTIPIRRLESGGLLLFTFFMISDPRTTPNSRAGRILFALLVAYGAWYVQFRLFRTNGLLWSLACFSMTVPVIDWMLPGTRYEWARPTIGRIAPIGVTHETADSGSRVRSGLRVVGPGAQRLLRLLRSQG